MTVETPFSSPQEAERAYYGSGSGSGSGGSDGSGSDDQPETTAGWTEPEQADTLEGGWALLYQDQTDGSRRRWFVAGGPDGGFLNTSGGVVTPDSNETMNDMPSFGTEQEARDAHASWLEANAQETDDEAESQWTKWAELEEVAPWFIYQREHVEDDRVQFVVAGENSEQSVVYLHPGGEIEPEVHIFEDPEVLGDALDAYFQAAQDGDVPEEQRPTGSKPERTSIQQDSDEQEQKAGGGPGDMVGKAVSLARNNPALAAGVAVGGYVVANEYGGDMI